MLCWTPGEQSVYRGGVGVDPAVTVPLSRSVPFVVPCVSRVVARAPVLWEREVPVPLSRARTGPAPSAVLGRGLLAPAYLCSQRTRSKRLSFVTVHFARLAVRA